MSRGKRSNACGEFYSSGGYLVGPPTRGNALGRTLAGMIPMTPFSPGLSIAIEDATGLTYPHREADREDLEILGRDLYGGFIKHTRDVAEHGRRKRKRTIRKRTG